MENALVFLGNVAMVSGQFLLNSQQLGHIICWDMAKLYKMSLTLVNSPIKGRQFLFLYLLAQLLKYAQVYIWSNDEFRTLIIIIKIN
jgi:hypothetical protein